MASTLDWRGQLDRESLIRDFDPNREDPNEWATYIPRWRGAFHTHKTRAGALRALNPRFSSWGILYQRVGDRWVEIERMAGSDLVPMNCEMCNKLRSQVQNSMLVFSGADDALKRVWIKNAGRIVDPPKTAWMCLDCRKRNR